jgi:hypothetical protein
MLVDLDRLSVEIKEMTTRVLKEKLSMAQVVKDVEPFILKAERDDKHWTNRYGFVSSREDVVKASQILSKLVVVNVMPTGDERLRYLHIIVRAFEAQFEVIKTKLNVDLTIMLKGGNAFRILAKQFHDELRSKAAEAMSQDTSLPDMSDFDFSMVRVGEWDESMIARYNEHKKSIQFVCYVTTMMLRDFLVLHAADVFPGISDLYQNPQTRFKYKSFLSNIQSQFNALQGSAYGGINLLGVAYKERLKTYQHGKRIPYGNYKIIPETYSKLFRNDFMIKEQRVFSTSFAMRTNARRVCDYIHGFRSEEEWNSQARQPRESIATSTLPEFHVRDTPYEIRRALYATYNDEIRPESQSAPFWLNRIKFTLLLYYEKDGVYKVDAVPAEVFDLTCQADTAAPADFTTVAFKTNNLTTSIPITSIGYMIKDLERVLFVDTNNQPWTDQKYKKRIKRLFWLVAIDFVNKCNVECLDYETRINDLRVGATCMANLSFKAELVNDLIVTPGSETLKKLISTVLSVKSTHEYQRWAVETREIMMRVYNALKSDFNGKSPRLRSEVSLDALRTAC